MKAFVLIVFLGSHLVSSFVLEEMETVHLEDNRVYFKDDFPDGLTIGPDDDQNNQPTGERGPDDEDNQPTMEEDVSAAFNGFPEALEASRTLLPFKAKGSMTPSDRSATQLSCGASVTLGGGKEYSFQSTPASCSYHLMVPAGVSFSVSCPTYTVDCANNNYLYLHKTSQWYYNYYCGPFTQQYQAESSQWQLNLRYLAGNGGGNIACTIRSSGGTPADPGSCGAKTNAGASGRIIEGGFAAEGEYPWQAHQRGIKYVTETSYSYYGCGATLISNNYMLTAAHCLPPDVDEVQYCFGSIDNTNCRKTVTAPKANIIIHPDWDQSNAGSVQPGDIALVRLPESLDYDANNHINRACLPSSTPNDNTDIEMIGWGKIDATQSSNMLKKAWTRKVTSNFCVSNPAYKIICLNQGATQNSPSGRSCQGDSGGYAGRDGTIYGVSSFTRMDGKQCISPNSYTDVFQYLSWINGYINSSG